MQTRTLDTPAMTFAWAMWRRFRVLLVIGWACFLVFGALSATFPAYCDAKFAAGAVAMAIMAYIWLAIALMLLFTYAEYNADVLARESCFPPRLARLPVTTRFLAGWPVAAGAASMAVLWLLMAQFVIEPWVARMEEPMPRWWPAVFSMAMLAWIQALIWLPFGLRGVRIVLILALVPTMLSLATGALENRVNEGLLVAVYAGLAVMGWALAFRGVRLARSGEVPDWSRWVRPFVVAYHVIISCWPSRRTAFASAAQAQYWFEWRLHGFTLPVVVALILPWALFPLWYENDVLSPSTTLIGALLVPVVMGGLFGSLGGGNNPGAKSTLQASAKGREIGLGPFSATLPLSTSQMTAAMIKATLWSTIVTWPVVFAMLAFAVTWTGTGANIMAAWRQWWGDASSGRAIAATGAAIVLLILATWKQQFDRLYFGLHGRAWVMRAFFVIIFVKFSIAMAGIGWLTKNPANIPLVLSWVPLVLWPVFVLRCIVAAWVIREQLRSGLISRRAVALGVLMWVVAATLLFAIFVWAVPADKIAPPLIGVAVVFSLPGVRMAAAPVVLSWNRHR